MQLPKSGSPEILSSFQFIAPLCTCSVQSTLKDVSLWISFLKNPSTSGLCIFLFVAAGVLASEDDRAEPGAL